MGTLKIGLGIGLRNHFGCVIVDQSLKVPSEFGDVLLVYIQEKLVSDHLGWRVSVLLLKVRDQRLVIQEDGLLEGGHHCIRSREFHHQFLNLLDGDSQFR